MKRSTLILSISIILGVIGSFYLAKGVILSSIEGFFALCDPILANNFALAKSMITQKAESTFGFLIILFTFILQGIAIFISERKNDKRISESKVWSILFIIIAVIITIPFYMMSINKQKDYGIEYVKMYGNRNPIFWDKLKDHEHTPERYYREIASLLCIEHTMYSDIADLKEIIKEDLNKS